MLSTFAVPALVEQDCQVWKKLVDQDEKPEGPRWFVPVSAVVGVSPEEFEAGAHPMHALQLACCGDSDRATSGL